MKKTLLIAAGILFCVPIAHNALGAMSQDATTGTVTITAGAVAGAQSITFDPSTNVQMNGNSMATSFAIGAYHSQALRKASGQAYGMAADSSKMYFQDISDSTAYTGLVGAGTNQSTSFTTTKNWNQL
jgi:hypothetical protein